MGQKINHMNLTELNRDLSTKSPEEIVSWALSVAKAPVVTTNFRPYSACILHAVTRKSPDIDVIWIDTGYNTPQTYSFALGLIEQLHLQMKVYVPQQTAAFRDVLMGIPDIDDPQHSLFTEQVKLEPFRRAMEIHKPDVWFTNLRKGQTHFRNSIDVLCFWKDGILKVLVLPVL
jgi:phosphoadenosine phosphosulfate reductase